MSFREQNIAAIKDFFAVGCKKEQLIGIELEHFVVDKETNESLPYEDGVEKILRELQPLYGEPVLSQGRIIGILRPGGDSFLGAEISLEPAAQLEISIAPSSSLSEIKNAYVHFTETISPILDEMNAKLFCAAYRPKGKAEEMPLIPKKRYELMDKHFKTTGKRGIHMMRGTASAQISIDYESEEDFIKKFYLANLLCPVFSAMFNETTVRGEIWKDVDPARSMVVPNALSGAFNFTDYANYIYEMPPIFILGDIYTAHKPNSEIFADRLLTHHDIEHITSMAFPDVRLRNVIEIRVADSMPIEKTLEFAGLVKKIFYNKATLDELMYVFPPRRK